VKKRDLICAIENVLIYDVDDDDTADRLVETILDDVIKVLQRDARLPHLTPADYDLLFADLARDACEALAPYSKLDTELAARAIADALIDEMNKEEDGHERREDPKAAETTIVSQ
jgi:hypothetical protein